MEIILNALGKVKPPLLGMNVSLNFNVFNMIGPQESLDSSGYFRYVGSLTYPPCTEGTIWNFYEKKLPISSAQVKNGYIIIIFYFN